MKLQIQDYMNNRILAKLEDYVVNLNLDAESVMSLMANEFYNCDDKLIDQIMKYVMYIIWLKDNQKSLVGAFKKFTDRLVILEKEHLRHEEKARRGRPDLDRDRKYIEERRREEERIANYSKSIHEQSSILNNIEEPKIKNFDIDLDNTEFDIDDDLDKTIEAAINEGISEQEIMAAITSINDQTEIESLTTGIIEDQTIGYIKLDENEIDYEKTIDFADRREIFNDIYNIVEDDMDSTTKLVEAADNTIEDISINTLFDKELTIENILNNSSTLTETFDNGIQTLEHEMTKTLGIENLDLDSIKFEEVDEDKDLLSSKMNERLTDVITNTLSSAEAISKTINDEFAHDDLLIKNENTILTEPIEIDKNNKIDTQLETLEAFDFLANYEAKYGELTQNDVTTLITQDLNLKEILEDTTILEDFIEDETTLEYSNKSESGTLEAFDFLANFEAKYGEVTIENNTILKDEISSNTNSYKKDDLKD